MKDSFSTVEAVQYMQGDNTVLWGIASVLQRLLSTLGDSFSTVEAVQYMRGDNISTVGGYLVLWRDNNS